MKKNNENLTFKEVYKVMVIELPKDCADNIVLRVFLTIITLITVIPFYIRFQYFDKE